MTKRIFITGGAGYVGAVLTPYLLQKGYKVTVLDLMIYGEDVLLNHKNLKKIKGDIRDVELLKKELHSLIDAGLSLPAASKYLAKKENLSRKVIYNLY